MIFFFHESNHQDDNSFNSHDHEDSSENNPEGQKKKFFFANSVKKKQINVKKSFIYKTLKIKKKSLHWISQYNSRIFFLFFFLFLLFSGIFLRLLHLGFQKLPKANYHLQKKNRGSILDRHGNVLSTTITTFSVYAHPKEIHNKKDTALALCSIFPHMSLADMMKTLQQNKSFVWLVRHITPEKKEEVQALGIQGLDVHRDYKRVFLHDNLFCHVVGLTDLDQNGLSGLEKFFDHHLKTQEEPLVTSLDLSLQHIFHYYLKEAIENFEAQGGNALMADIKTGEILAMVSLPDFSPYEPIDVQNPSFFNRNTTGVYEFGSIMKIINTALFLEKGEGGLKKIFDARGCLWVGRFKVTDFQGLNRPMTVYEGFLNSSNLVNAQMALFVGGKKQYEFFKALGFTEPFSLELKEKSKPLIAPFPWAKATIITSSYGYGFAVTPLHVVNAMRAIVNGYYSPSTLLRPKIAQNGVPMNDKISPLVSKTTSANICYLLQQAVLEGKVKKARASNCLVGAKTGTANCRRGGRYVEKENMTSCVGIFPINDPKYIIVVTLDRPKASAKTYGYATAGWIAAPLVSVLVEKSVPILGLLNHHQKLLCLKKDPEENKKDESGDNEEKDNDEDLGEEN